MRRKSIRCAGKTAAIASTFLVALLQMQSAVAVPFTTDLSVTGTLTFDTAFADPGSGAPSPYAISGTGAQSGTMAVTAGGAAATTTYSGFSVSGSNPRTAALTDLGDRIAISSASASSTDSGTFAVGVGSPTVPTQMALKVHNNSATVGYHMSFTFGIDNQVGSNGPDAFAHSQFSLSDNSGEFKFSDLTSDTVNGNVKNTVSGGTGGPVTDSQSGTFSYDVLAGGDLNLHGFWTLEGGSFASGGTASSFFDVFVNLTDVAPLNQPPTNPAPIPGTLALLGLGLGALARARGRRTA